mmetsp:Transcript_144215/g.401871  ORF Transcript_144215/g.401871 Transcript_144215/m.401871 type:complete len:117 (-) Transcript_144215:99-449(-)
MMLRWASWLLAAPLLVALSVLGRRAWSCFWQWRRKQRRLDAINSEYETLRSVRQDAVYHHGWANSRGDYKEAESHEQHVMDIDKKLDNLRRQYEAVEAGQLEEVDGVIVEETFKDK